ncbi:MAG: cob(I)yrinic acid a,c-diamide adenosyltransferase [Chlamydiae bacterium]|nr:MAG: cob(I)yrinic acid a,c-diamide adenosyltransferase [Chlamydiota bacterium]
MKGYIQVYTGNGKGKTTAALGLALRASGAGLKVYFAQFIKGMDYSELYSVKRLSDNITLKQYGRECFIYKEPDEEDFKVARNGFSEVTKIIAEGKYDIVVLDEINIAIYYKLISVEEVLELLDNKPENVELVLTGRNVDKKIIERADLVTEMKEIKHYYQKGIHARKGIES